MRPQTHGHNSVKSQLIYNFFTRRFLSKFAVNWLLKILPLLARVATLPWETLMSETERLTPGSVATYGVAGYITKLRKVYCRVWQWKTFLIGKYLAKLQARTWSSCALSSSLAARWLDPETTEPNFLQPSRRPKPADFFRLSCSASSRK